MATHTEITIDARKVRDFPTFLAQISLTLGGNENAYFGWDLHSFQDCLFGGCVGSPPYAFNIRNADDLIAVLGHEAMARYCESMLSVIRAGGRGLVDADSSSWFEQHRDLALSGHGATLLDAIVEVIESSSSLVVLWSSNGRRMDIKDRSATTG